MNLACQKTLGQITKEVGFGETPPPLFFQNSHIFPFIFFENVPYHRLSGPNCPPAPLKPFLLNVVNVIGHFHQPQHNLLDKHFKLWNSKKYLSSRLSKSSTIHSSFINYVFWAIANEVRVGGRNLVSFLLFPCAPSSTCFSSDAQFQFNELLQLNRGERFTVRFLLPAHSLFLCAPTKPI